MQLCYHTPRYLLSAAQLKRRCQLVSYEQIMEHLSYTDDVIARLASKSVLPVLAKDAFCDTTKRSCAFFENGDPLFWDAHHLNAAGSPRLAKHMEVAFVALVRESQTGHSQ